MSEAMRLGDRYELGDVLGRGGMAEVHRGRDLRLGREVAIKMLKVDLARDPSFQARFRREAQSAASLNHPAIVAVYDTGEDRIDDLPTGAPIPYIVMEYVNGETLREVLNSGRKLLPERAMEIVAETLQALDYSHRHGIVHRDIKPANVMLTRTGDVKVMDFGIARAVTDSSVTMTQTSAVIGTAQYLSPEQARGEQVDARSDLYSTGCMLFELLTGRPPFIGDSPVSVAYQHVREEPPIPSTLNPELSAAVDAIVAKSLAKDREDRYQSAAEMRDDLQRHLAGRPVAAPAVLAGATQRLNPVSAPATTTLLPGAAYDGGNGRDEHRGNRAVPWLLGAVAVIAVIALGLALATSLFSGGTDQVTVPDVAGSTQPEAEAELEAAGLEVGPPVRRSDDAVPVDIVIETDPPSGDAVASGSAVSLVLSAGPNATTVPTLAGLDLADAREALQSAGLTLASPVEEVDSAEEEGRVLAADPPDGTSVAPGSAVALRVANGNNVVPSVEGQSENAARSALEQAGFEVDVDEERDEDVDPGTVIDQDPRDESRRLGTTVTIVVATGGDDPSPTPTEDETTPEPTRSESPSEQANPPNGAVGDAPPQDQPSDDPGGDVPPQARPSQDAVGDAPPDQALPRGDGTRPARSAPASTPLDHRAGADQRFLR